GGGFGNSTYYSDQRISLPADLAPGASVTLSIYVHAPPVHPRLVLVYRLHLDGQFCFAQFAAVTATVRQPSVATYSVAGTPTSCGSNLTDTSSVTVTNACFHTWPRTASEIVVPCTTLSRSGGGFGNSTYYSDQRISLPADLAPGASVTL